MVPKMAVECLYIILLCCVSTIISAQEVDQLRPAPPPPSGCRAGFSVRKAETRNLSTGQRIRFQDVLTNIGGWSQSSSDFKAPCSGVFYFSFHAISSANSDFTVALMKNGVYQVTAYGSEADYQHGSNSALLVLEKGDSVHLRLQDGKLYEHPSNEAYNSFSGFLVDKV